MANENQGLAVSILPYDSKAPEIFEAIKQFICDIIPYQIGVEHIGSTVIVGLGGKGIIDILIITRQEYMWKIVELLESKGYKYNPEASIIPDRDYLRQHLDEAPNYYELKKQWSIAAGSDRIKFSELKTVYINEVLEKARKELKE
jgi:GrpB-like predicted nucleotidyltransferase (UPF0157 family)